MQDLVSVLARIGMSNQLPPEQIAVDGKVPPMHPPPKPVYEQDAGSLPKAIQINNPVWAGLLDLLIFVCAALSLHVAPPLSDIIGAQA